MKVILDRLRLREADGRNLRHAFVEIAGDGLHPLASGSREPVQGLADDLGLGALTMATRVPCVPWRALFVRTVSSSPWLIATSSRLRCAPTFSGKTSHVGGMRACRPRGEVAERLVVLSHKPLGIQEMSLGNRGQRQGLGVSLGLFKKPHTPLPVASRRQ